MTGPPRFSIVIPTYNGEPFLAETLDSVLRQTVADWQVVIVDDGSTDGSAAVAERYVDERIRLFRQANAGVSAARQNGLDRCAGRFVTFLDQDDRLVPDALARFAAVMEGGNPPAVAYGDRVYIDPDGNRFGSETGPIFQPRPSGDVFTTCLTSQLMTTPGQTCISARHLRTIGRIPDTGEISDDWALWCLLASLGEFRFLDGGPILEYRWHAANKIHRFMDRTDDIHIREQTRSMDLVFNHAICRRKAGDLDLGLYKRRRQAHCYSMKGDRYLREREWRTERRYLRQAIRLDWRKPRPYIVYVLSLAQWLPKAVQRLMGEY